MITDPFTLNNEKTLLKRSRRWNLLAMALCVLGVIVQQPLLLLTSLFALVIGLVPALWYRHGLRHLSIDLQANLQQVFFGEEVTFFLSIENQKWLPLPWLKVECAVTPSLTILLTRTRKRERITQLAHTWVLWPLQRVTRSYRMRCLARGVYVFGPVSLRTGDPFGWFEREITIPLREALLVYPLVMPLEVFGLSWLRPLGEEVTERRLLEDPLQLAGVRDYQVGDDPRRIHWKATARAGTLQSKLYEYTSSPRVLLLLDTWNYAQAWAGVDQEIQEFAIAVTASLAIWALNDGSMVGLLTNSAMRIFPDEQVREVPFSAQAARADSEDAQNLQISPPGVSVPFARDQGQYERLLTTLACLISSEHLPLEQLIDQEEGMLRQGAAVIVVSAATTLNAETVERLLDLRWQGVTIHLVVIGDREQQAIMETHDLPVCFLGSEQWHEHLRVMSEESYEHMAAAPLQLDREHHHSAR